LARGGGFNKTHKPGESAQREKGILYRYWGTRNLKETKKRKEENGRGKVTWTRGEHKSVLVSMFSLVGKKKKGGNITFFPRGEGSNHRLQLAVKRVCKTEKKKLF